MGVKMDENAGSALANDLDIDWSSLRLGESPSKGLDPFETTIAFHPDIRAKLLVSLGGCKNWQIYHHVIFMLWHGSVSSIN